MTPLEMDAILLALRPFPMERTVNPLGLDVNTFCLFMRGGRSLSAIVFYAIRRLSHQIHVFPSYFVIYLALLASCSPSHRTGFLILITITTLSQGGAKGPLSLSLWLHFVCLFSGSVNICLGFIVRFIVYRSMLFTFSFLLLLYNCHFNSWVLESCWDIQLCYFWC